jgi:hypothetical protein
MTKPDAGGAGHNPYWTVNRQLEIEGDIPCMDNSDIPCCAGPKGAECQRLLKVELLLDAFRSFETCFSIRVDPVLGAYPSEQVCSDPDLLTWSARSSFHAALARAAIERLHSTQ